MFASLLVFSAAMFLIHVPAVNSCYESALCGPGLETSTKPKEIINKIPKYGEIHLELEEETILKESDSDPRYMLRHIWDLAVDSKGNIYLLDDDKISKFDYQRKFIAAVGRKGQGPGEFMGPLKLFLDNKDNLYVNDQGTSLVKFDSEGTFIELIRLKFIIPFMPVEARNFYVDEEGNIFSFYREYTEKGAEKSLVKASKDGLIEKKLAFFLEKSIKVSRSARGGVVGGHPHAYSPTCFFCAVGNDKLCYGENTNYRIFIIDNEGNVNIIFVKEEKAQPITGQEKERYRKAKDLYFPPHRPFFKAILSDEKGRIYVVKMRSILDKTRVEEIDIFNNSGIYLYKTTLEYFPLVIRNGWIYVLDKDEQEHREIKRLRIKNYHNFKDN